ncbi:MAG TPA: DUF3822 family protein [Bacteroidales bacterium]|nr:DUF3822 family protein [Bacteroidales bacterium]
MPLFELYDETLDINSTENYRLAVQLSPDDLSLSILDTLRNKFILIRSYEPETGNRFDDTGMGEIISRDDFLLRRFKKIHIVTPSSKSILVPSPLYEDSHRDEYFRFNFHPDEGHIVMANKIQEPDASLLFTVPQSRLELIQSLFPGSNPVHHLEPLLQAVAGGRRSSYGNHVHVHLENEFFNMIVHDQNSLRFCNTFNYQSLPDIQYYVFYVIKRLNIGQDEVIYFSGKTEKYERMVQDFSRYARNIRYAEPSGNFTFSYVFTEMLRSKFFNLFMVLNCE